MGRCREIDQPKSKPKAKKFVPADPRCEQCYYWRSMSGYRTIGLSCCHYMLETGLRREKISKTECDSFVDKNSKPKRAAAMQEVPMVQWGCGGLGIFRVER